MDLEFAPEYTAFRQQVQTFIKDNRKRAPRARNLRSPDVLAWQQLLIEAGYTARTIPKEYGGFGARPDILKSRIIGEEFARAQVPAGMSNQGISMLVPTLLELGTEDQKRRFIKPTLQGEMVWCQGYSEPNAGSDLASLTTRAELVGEEWIVNGQKIWTSGAHVADWIFCLVRTEPEAEKHHGISYLLFSMDTPGIDIRPLKTVTGDASFNEVFFTDVHVPKDQIVGERGKGWQVANATLTHERGMLGDPDAQLARFNALVRLMQRETLDGESLMQHPVYRDRLMAIQGRVMAMRFNDLRILSARLNRGKPSAAGADLAGLIVKLQGTELRHDLEGLAIDVLGELGILYDDSPYLRNQGSWQVQYMFYLGLIIGGGTSQIQKNIISERGLNMPREPRVSTNTHPSTNKKTAQ